MAAGASYALAIGAPRPHGPPIAQQVAEQDRGAEPGHRTQSAAPGMPGESWVTSTSTFVAVVRHLEPDLSPALSAGQPPSGTWLNVVSDLVRIDKVCRVRPLGMSESVAGRGLGVGVVDDRFGEIAEFVLVFWEIRVR